LSGWRLSREESLRDQVQRHQNRQKSDRKTSGTTAGCSTIVVVVVVVGVGVGFFDGSLPKPDIIAIAIGGAGGTEDDFIIILRTPHPPPPPIFFFLTEAKHDGISSAHSI
jgi:hypothetical protein